MNQIWNIISIANKQDRRKDTFLWNSTKNRRQKRKNPFTTTLCLLLVRKSAIQLWTLPFMPYDPNLLSSLAYATLSNALAKGKVESGSLFATDLCRGRLVDRAIRANTRRVVRKHTAAGCKQGYQEASEALGQKRNRRHHANDASKQFGFQTWKIAASLTRLNIL